MLLKVAASTSLLLRTVAYPIVNKVANLCTGIIADLVDDISDSAFTELGVSSLLTGGRRHHQSRHVNTAASIEKPPDQRGQQ